jgi:hypothetical protein
VTIQYNTIQYNTIQYHLLPHVVHLKWLDVFYSDSEVHCPWGRFWDSGSAEGVGKPRNVGAGWWSCGRNPLGRLPLYCVHGCTVKCSAVHWLMRKVAGPNRSWVRTRYRLRFWRYITACHCFWWWWWWWWWFCCCCRHHHHHHHHHLHGLGHAWSVPTSWRVCCSLHLNCWPPVSSSFWAVS